MAQEQVGPRNAWLKVSEFLTTTCNDTTSSVIIPVNWTSARCNGQIPTIVQRQSSTEQFLTRFAESQKVGKGALKSRGSRGKLIKTWEINNSEVPRSSGNWPDALGYMRGRDAEESRTNGAAWTRYCLRVMQRAPGFQLWWITSHAGVGFQWRGCLWFIPAPISNCSTILSCTELQCMHWCTKRDLGP